MTNIHKSAPGRSILFTKNHVIDAQLSEYLQLSEIVNQLYDLMSMIETVRIDNNEFVALRVLILLSPGKMNDLDLWLDLDLSTDMDSPVCFA